jgi:hypothetical protein
MDQDKLHSLAIDFAAKIIAPVLGTILVALLITKNRNPQITIEEVKSVDMWSALGFSGYRAAFEQQHVTNIFLTTVWIGNTGTKPIKEEDFFDPISVSVEPTNQIIGVVNLGSSPTQFDFEFLRTGEVLRLKPLKLNPGDSLLAMVMTTAWGDPKLTWAGRLVGRSQIDFHRKA